MDKVGGITWSRSQVSTSPKMMPKMRKEEYFRKISINPESRIKQEKQESSKKKESRKKRKKKESQIKAKQGNYVHSWVTYSHRSPSQVTCSMCQH